ncbi:MAG: ABC transporter ATP-binding protein [Elusimicrobia bacterium]|nr:ABC transporter ATP-binding protein [Elusimicrobiota bacterium]
MSHVVQCRELQKIYGRDFAALRGISFDIAAGEMIAVVGPSGCGKSTLLNILGLLDHLTSGSYLLMGEESLRLSESKRTLWRRRHIGFVFQAFNLLPRLSTLENVMLPLSYLGQSRARSKSRAGELLDMLGLGLKSQTTPLELSGGERQRVGIARALANDPDLILADEPTGNLDSKTGADIWRIFEELHQKGRTIVIVTHDPALAAKAGRVLRIQDGQIVANPNRRTS